MDPEVKRALDIRLARGEISAAEYHKLVKLITDPPGPETVKRTKEQVPTKVESIDQGRLLDEPSKAKFITQEQRDAIERWAVYFQLTPEEKQRAYDAVDADLGLRQIIAKYGGDYRPLTDEKIRWHVRQQQRDANTISLLLTEEQRESLDRWIAHFHLPPGERARAIEAVRQAAEDRELWIADGLWNEGPLSDSTIRNYVQQERPGGKRGQGYFAALFVAVALLVYVVDPATEWAWIVYLLAASWTALALAELGSARREHIGWLATVYMVQV
jgi:hypothetical protein